MYISPFLVCEIDFDKNRDTVENRAVNIMVYKDSANIDLGGRCEALPVKDSLIDLIELLPFGLSKFLVEMCSQTKKFDFS